MVLRIHEQSPREKNTSIKKEKHPEDAFPRVLKGAGKETDLGFTTLLLDFLHNGANRSRNDKDSLNNLRIHNNLRLKVEK